MFKISLSVVLRSFLAVTVVAGSLVLLASPAAAVSTLVVFSPETRAVRGEGNPSAQTDQIRATFVVRHDVGVTVTGMKGWQGQSQSQPGSYGTLASYGSTARVMSPGGNYTVVEASFDPGSGNWMGSACPLFGTQVRVRNITANIHLQMSDGTQFTTNSWTLQALSAGSCSGPEDPSTILDVYDSTLNAVVPPGGSIRTHYRCDDSDTSGSADQCDNMIISVRNAGTGARVILECSTSSVPCENSRQFNADDNVERNGLIPVPASLPQGRWIIEADTCSESQRNATLTTCFGGADVINNQHQRLGSFYYNPGAPTVSLSSSFTGGGNTVGGVLRPNTNATVNYTAATSSDAQVASWDLDDNGSFETVERGETNPQAAPVLSAAQKVKSRNTTSLPEGSSCAVRVQVRDNGGINAADPSSLATASTSSQACTVNRRPTGANATVTTHQGVGSTINLTNADGDGDPRTCNIVGAPTKGVVSGGTSCSRTYTPNVQANTTDSFTYTVSDDHAGTSTTYTITINIVNAVPTATPQTVNVDAGAATAITLAGTDPDGDTLTCQAPVSGPSKGSLSGANCGRSYTSSAGSPNDGLGGTDSFTFTVQDPTGAATSTTSAPATVTINIANPDLSLLKSHTGRFQPGTGTGTYTLTVGNTTSAPAPGTTTIVDTLPAGMFYRSFTAGTSGFSCTGTPGVSTVVNCTRASTIPEGFSGSLTITVDVVEGASSPATNNAVIYSNYELAATAADNTADDVTLVNRRPTAESQSVGTDENDPVNITLVADDPDGDTLTYDVVQPANGSVSGIGNLRQYTPDSGFVGVDTFTFTVTDIDSLVSTPATVTVYVGVSKLAGVVTDEVTDDPLQGIEVRLVDHSNPSAVDPALLATAVTDATGAYDFADEYPALGAVPHGDYVIRFVDTTNDYISEWYVNAPNRASASSLSLDRTTPVNAVDAELMPGGRVQGTVRSTAGGNPAIDGLQVRLFKIGDPGSRAVTTAGGGQYRFELLTAGSYQLWFRDVSTTQWVSEWYDEQPTQATAATITLTAGQQVLIDEFIDPVAPPPPPNTGTISGIVRSTAGGNPPIAGVQVRLYKDPYGASAAATTDGGGTYSFTNLAPGNYKVWFRIVTGNAYVSEYFNDQVSLGAADVITIDNDSFVADALLAPGAAPPPPNSAVVSGTVTQIDGVTPIAGLQVRLYVSGEAAGSTATTTDANGFYQFTNRAPGNYQVWFRDVSNSAWISEWHQDKPNQATADPVAAANLSTATVNAQLVAK